MTKHARLPSVPLLALLPVLLALGSPAGAQAPRSEPLHAPVTLASPVQDKNFYLLSIFERSPAAKSVAANDPALARIASARSAALGAAAKSCNLDLECHAAAFRWSDPQLEEVAAALQDLYRSSAPVRALVDGPLRDSGMYARWIDLPGDQLIGRAWSECARGINRIIAVYGLGQAPRYPAIDSITYDPKSAAWQRNVQSLTAILEQDRASRELFFSASLRFAGELLWLNHRDEAGRLEPMEAGENAAAFRRAKSVNWAQYPYSVIVVPGAGNDRPGVRLSPGGKLRDEIAAMRFREGKAPFILVSGGYVHPERTEFSEAVEMKRDLMTRFGIPAGAIVIDPHARHTTTNMRNAARLIYRYGMPFDKKALVATDLSQSKYIENAAFQKRCQDELGYVPFELLGRTSPFDLEFLPRAGSLHTDPQDPLDP